MRLRDHIGYDKWQRPSWSRGWDAWLGPVAERDYSPAYVPYKWRFWWDYGTGETGSLAIELITPDDGAVLPALPPATFQWQTDIPYKFKIEFAPASSFPGTKTIAFPPEEQWMPDNSTDTIPAQKWQKTWNMVRKMEQRSGIVYWRVIGRSGPSVPPDTSETRSFTIAD